VQSSETTNLRWYQGVSSYQWLVLIIASAGWIFDVYEGQVFNLTRTQMLADILHVPPDHPSIKSYGDLFLGIFLLGGTVGGLLFGSMADRIGRKPTMALTILIYSLFAGLTYFAQTLWQVASLRFLVAMGVGGEWAVAASLVAEVFPARARTYASGIFHTSSVFGAWGATFAGLLVGSQWRYAYLIGVAPALLVAWVMASVKEPESAKSPTQSQKRGSIKELLTNPRWATRAILGMLLAAVGLAGFWAVAVAGQDLAREMLLHDGLPASEAAERAKFAFGFIQATGAGLGLLAFGPLCARFGRRRAFTWSLIAAFLIVPLTCYAPRNYTQLILLLPAFGFLTTGLQAGCAIYFPELFPTHLRATGAGFCFNVGRTLAAPVLFFSGWLKAQPSMNLKFALSAMAAVFLLGLIVVRFLPETKDQPLPE
jgi:MFS family permease